MYLKSLTLKGFKSFADATTLTLEPGVTVVVGPNGSGKSNVVDAMAWVLGAQAPKAVRSQKMDDVIFAGTASRPALGRAEVAITIDNSDGTLGVEFNEITVTRVLFRSGESEYMINGVPCRLLDVQELLSDAGVGRQQHVIVSQGQIDAVLNARPEDRRSIIEEAAGVLKFRKRKEKAERRLDATEANLLRVQDLLREVRRQLKPLERQAKAAERHGDLVAELTALRIFVAGREIASLRTTLEKLAGVKLDSENAERELKSSLATLDTAIMSIEAELSARGASDVADRLRRVEQLKERGRGLAAVLSERRRSLERDRGQLLDADVVATLEADAARFRSELETVVDDLAGYEPASRELAAEEEAFRGERDADDDTGDDESGAGRAVGAAAEVRGELRSVVAQLERAENEVRRSERRRETLTEKIEAVGDEIARFRAVCASAAELEGTLYDEVAAAEAARVGADEVVTTAEARSTSADATESTARARVDALQMALDAAHQRAGAERLADVDGVVGTLLDLVEIDAGWEPAVEAALGESLTAVVVADPSAARRALDELAGSDTSGAVIALGRPGGPGAAGRAPSVGDSVRAHVRGARPGVDPLLDVLLAGAVRVRSVSDAIDASLAHADAVVVTDSGDRFGATGWRVGAAGQGVTAAALDDAVGAAERAAVECESARTALADARAVAATALAAEREVTRRLDENDDALGAASEGVSRAQGERRQLTAEFDAVGSAIDEAGEAVAAATARRDELAALLPALESDEAAEVEAARVRADRRSELER
ncbi:MAG: AAA family ATPase, partial [Actinomycetota bacterium]